MGNPTEQQANDIVALVNEHSAIANPVNAELVLQHEYAMIMAPDGVVLACAKMLPVSWYQAEISHLVVRPDYRTKGLGIKALDMACQEAIAHSLKVAQCTIRCNNSASERLFTSAGFVKTLEFTGISGHRLGLWQRLLE